MVNSLTVTFLLSISIVSPLLAFSYSLSPPFFKAEKIGGFWLISPIKCVVDSLISSSVIWAVS